MSSYAGTAYINPVTGGSAVADTGAVNVRARKIRTKNSSRTTRNFFLLFASMILAVFILVGLSAYAASLQHANNVLEQENKNLQAEIFSLNSQIVDETKVTKIEKIATEKYGMVYPTSENCVVISEKEDGPDNLAAIIRSEAYN